MGSGGSKPEDTPRNKPSENTKPALKSSSVSEKKALKENIVFKDNRQSSVQKNENSIKQTDSHNEKKLPVINNNSNSKFSSNTLNLSKNFNEESILDLDTDWKEKNNLRTSTNNVNNRESELNAYNTQNSRSYTRQPQHEYPETYAERNLREQYTKHEQMIRQKTIYRDPEEWDISDRESEASFDVSKFKAANKSVQQPKRDIFNMTPDYRYNSYNDSNADEFYQRPAQQKRKSVPKYDITEEELMADIEKDCGY